MAKKQGTTKTVEALKHDEAKRKNIPTAEYQSVLQKEQQSPIRIAYERRNQDLDPQLVWRGKDGQDWSDLVVHAPPLYIQEKVHPKALIDDLLRETKERAHEAGLLTPDLFADFNGIPKGVDKTEFYQHDQNWSNRMILGDSLQVMASLAEREGLRGKVQCIYFDPPYGIKFNSNFQWSTTSRDVKDGNADHITREPEQVKAFRDTWRDGIHSYLTYLRDRLTVARDLLTDTGSIFLQIGDENVHRVRVVMDEVFGDENFVSSINYVTTSGRQDSFIDNISNHILWFAKSAQSAKYRQLYIDRPDYSEEFIADQLQSDGLRTDGDYEIYTEGRVFTPKPGNHWKVKKDGAVRVARADRLIPQKSMVRYKRCASDFSVRSLPSVWSDTSGGAGKDKIYVVQSNARLAERCILMATDPGDLVLDPTCGSGTTAYVAEQWGRRWITVDTSRVALALARARIMGARYPYYLLADSREGQLKEAEISGKWSVAGDPAISGKWSVASDPNTSHKPLVTSHQSLRHGFVYERVPHITLKSIANNAEIDVIWDKWEQRLAPLRGQLSVTSGQKKTLEEWEVPRERPHHWPQATEPLLTDFWQVRIARQQEIDKSIAAKAEFEYLYDRPYEDKKKVRVAGPFTVESLSPHRVLGVDENDELIDPSKESSPDYGAKQTFAQMILDNLKTSGVQQAHKDDKITFTALTPWPGDLVCAEGRYLEGDKEKRAAIFIGPEFGTVTRPDLVEAAREAGDAGFDVLIACAFNYEAHTTEFSKLGRIPVLKARMNADLHMADDLKNTGKGNLFVIFGEPDIDILKENDGKLRIKVKGVDVFKPQTGEVISDSAEGIACWFIDTDYNEESFFVRHAYFLGTNDPYSSLKTTLKAEIDPEAWATLNSDTSRAFNRPKSGRIAVKVINHLGDEVMKVFKV